MTPKKMGSKLPTVREKTMGTSMPAMSEKIYV
jgi:hypothetical protein